MSRLMVGLRSHAVGQVQALKVMHKETWLKFKDEFKQIVRDIAEINGQLPVPPSREPEQLPRYTGCLVQLRNLPESTTKPNLQILIAHLVRPEYVDYKRGGSSAIVRFATATMADTFIEKYKTKDKALTLGSEDIVLQKLSKEEETEYLRLAEQQRQEFKDYRSHKKKKLD
jgi:hypothetical protein